MNASDAKDKPKISALAALLAFFRPKPLLMLALGYASGMPFLLVNDTLSAWLRVEGLSLQVIGFFVLVTFSYTLKFMWAPLLDRLNVPWLNDRLGHRRAWMLVLQAAVALGLLGIAATNPTVNLGQMAAFAALTAFFGASQDIVMDAWRIESVEPELQGIMTAAYQWGYRIAMMVAGAVPLILSSRIGWPLAYATMALMMIIGWIAVLLAPRGPAHHPRPIHYEGLAVRPALEVMEWIGRALLILIAALAMGSGLTANADLINGLIGHIGVSLDAQAAFKAAFTSKQTGPFLQIPFTLVGLALMMGACLPLPWPTRPGAYFKGAFIEPLADFFRRYKDWAGFIFALICLYRISEFTLSIMNPFYVDLGFSLDVVGEMRKGFGVLMLVIGVGIAGWLIARFGVRKSLLIGAIVGPFSHIGFMWLACAGHSLPIFAVALAMDNIAASIAGTALIAYMSTLVSPQYTAPQYAIFSSFYAILGKLVASQSGRIVEGSAKAADAGGFSAIFKGLMGHLHADSYTVASAKLAVTPAAMGAGYFAFFAYTIVIGFVAIAMCIWLHIRRVEGSELKAEQPQPE
ncbi:AmpG family muropeptide MFS transporter [Asticcacaulis sp. 201]|uniref:AmpG family muropeptide MFS transporter n=1 Tax=Asticcacaulis sp. 201 TaxID=3028787 RepID=UPI0029167759|nr:MFS transporter [Asticcacaulis sp. 201]MDV6331530.1 MFS transporter [Asticcacaulis sp. 201]